MGEGLENGLLDGILGIGGIVQDGHSGGEERAFPGLNKGVKRFLVGVFRTAKEFGLCGFRLRSGGAHGLSANGSHAG